MSEDIRSIELTRISENHYRATAPSGASIEFGRGEGLMTPVELLLAAVAGCSSIDVDTVTSRHTEPTKFDVAATADKIDEDGASRVDNVHLDFDLAFPDDEEGRKADARIERLVGLSHDKYRRDRQLSASRFFSTSTSKSAAGHCGSMSTRASSSSRCTASLAYHFRFAGTTNHGAASVEVRSKTAW